MVLRVPQIYKRKDGSYGVTKPQLKPGYSNELLNFDHLPRNPSQPRGSPNTKSQASSQPTAAKMSAPAVKTVKTVSEVQSPAKTQKAPGKSRIATSSGASKRRFSDLESTFSEVVKLLQPSEKQSGKERPQSRRPPRASKPQPRPRRQQSVTPQASRQLQQAAASPASNRQQQAIMSRSLSQQQYTSLGSSFYPEPSATMPQLPTQHQTTIPQPFNGQPMTTNLVPFNAEKQTMMSHAFNPYQLNTMYQNLHQQQQALMRMGIDPQQSTMTPQTSIQQQQQTMPPQVIYNQQAMTPQLSNHQEDMMPSTDELEAMVSEICGERPQESMAVLTALQKHGITPKSPTQGQQTPIQPTSHQQDQSIVTHTSNQDESVIMQPGASPHQQSDTGRRSKRARVDNGSKQSAATQMTKPVEQTITQSESTRQAAIPSQPDQTHHNELLAMLFPGPVQGQGMTQPEFNQSATLPQEAGQVAPVAMQPTFTEQLADTPTLVSGQKQQQSLMQPALAEQAVTTEGSIQEPQSMTELLFGEDQQPSPQGFFPLGPEQGFTQVQTPPNPRGWLTNPAFCHLPHQVHSFPVPLSLQMNVEQSASEMENIADREKFFQIIQRQGFHDYPIISTVQRLGETELQKLLRIIDVRNEDHPFKVPQKEYFYYPTASVFRSLPRAERNRTDSRTAHYQYSYPSSSESIAASSSTSMSHAEPQGPTDAQLMPPPPIPDKCKSPDNVANTQRSTAQRQPHPSGVARRPKSRPSTMKNSSQGLFGPTTSVSPPTVARNELHNSSTSPLATNGFPSFGPASDPSFGTQSYSNDLQSAPPESLNLYFDPTYLEEVYRNTAEEPPNSQTYNSSSDIQRSSEHESSPLTSQNSIIQDSQDLLEYPSQIQGTREAKKHDRPNEDNELQNPHSELLSQLERDVALANSLGVTSERLTDFMRTLNRAQLPNTQSFSSVQSSIPQPIPSIPHGQNFPWASTAHSF